MANNKKKIDKKVRDESWKLKKFDIPQHSEDDVKQKRNQLKQLKNNAKNKQNPTPLDEIFIMTTNIISEYINTLLDKPNKNQLDLNKAHDIMNNIITNYNELS